MIIAKWLLGALLVAGLAYSYDNRDFVVDAYEIDDSDDFVVEERPVADISDYIDLSKIRTIDYESADYIVRDTRRVALPIPTAGVETITEPKVQGGTGSVAGTVTFEGEPVPGAEVQVERIVGDLSSSITTTANAAGDFTVGTLLGGRYRIRAYLPPSLSMRNAEVLFLPDNGQAKDLQLSLSNESSSKFTGRFVGDVARVGVNYTVAVEFRSAQVNDEGIIEDGPVPNELVAITVRKPLTVNGSILQTSDATGIARFTVRCSKEGNGRITITSRNTDQNVTVPPCTVPPAPEPEPVPVGGSFGQGSQIVAPKGTYQGRPAPQRTNNSGQRTTTTQASGNGNGNGRQQGSTTTAGQSPTTGATPSSTTGNQGSSTTQGRTAETRSTQNFAPRSFRFQSDFNTAFAGSSICVLQYQLWQGDEWGPVFTHAGGAVVVFNRIARVQPSGGTPCEYVRVA